MEINREEKIKEEEEKNGREGDKKEKGMENKNSVRKKISAE